MNNLVSIIMPNYNGAQFVSQAIQSVVNQSFVNWELLIVDDKSKDNSIDIINVLLKSDLRIKLFILDENKGASYARNFAISKSKGRYIAFLDSDDVWKPLKLEKQLEILKKMDCALTYSSYELINENNTKMGIVNIKYTSLSYNKMLRSNYIGCLTAIYDTAKVGKMYMNEKLKSHEDYLLWLNILGENNMAYGSTSKLASYRIVNYSLSSSKIKQGKNHWFFLRKILKILYIPSLYFFLTYSLSGLRKKIRLNLYRQLFKL